MRRRRVMAFAVTLPMGFVIAVWAAWLREPSYGGHTLSWWLLDLREQTLSTTGNAAPARQAIRAIGNKALPELLHRVQAERPHWKETLEQTLDRWVLTRRVIRLHFDGEDELRQAAEAREAKEAYSVLGSIAGCQVPALIALLTNSPSPQVRERAAWALGGIGPAAEPAVPALIAMAKNRRDVMRYSAFSTLLLIHPAPQLVVPELVECLDDPSCDSFAAQALAAYGTNAQAAVPGLMARITNSIAAWALEQIDPEAAAKAGVQ